VQRGFETDEPDCEAEVEPDVEERPGPKPQNFQADAAVHAELRRLLQAEEAELQEKRFMVQAARRSLQNFLGITRADQAELILLQSECADEQQQIAEWMQSMDEREKALLEEEKNYQGQQEEMRQMSSFREQETPPTPIQSGDSKPTSQCSEVKAQLRAMEEQQTLVMERIGTLRKESKRCSEDREKLNNRIDSIRSERRSLQAALKAARRCCSEAECRSQEMKDMLDTDAGQVGKLESQVSQLRTEVEELSAKVLAPPPEPVDAVCRQLQEKVVQLRKDLGSRRAEISMLKEELAKNPKLSQ